MRYFILFTLEGEKHTRTVGTNDITTARVVRAAIINQNPQATVSEIHDKEEDRLCISTRKETRYLY